MIRDARFQDIPDIKRMLHEMHRHGKYASRVEIDDKAADALLMGAVAGQGQRGPQSSLVKVSEHDGKLTGFMVGVLDRVYHIGKLLTANDVFLHCRKSAHPADAIRLIDAYIDWARSNPKVIEIMLSWADTLPGAERIARVYQRKGFVKIGEMFELRTDIVAREAA